MADGHGNAPGLAVAVGVIARGGEGHAEGRRPVPPDFGQTRRIGTTEKERRAACRYNLIDSVVALNGALLVNAAILVMAAAVFFKNHCSISRVSKAFAPVRRPCWRSGSPLMW